MQLSRLIPLVVVLALLLGSIGLVDQGQARAPAANAQEGGAPLVYLTAQRTGDGVRYAVSLNRAGNLALRNVRVDVQLPADAALVDAFATPGYTEFLGSAQGTLRWQAPDFPAGAPVDDFTFLLREAPAGEFIATVRWEGTTTGSEQWRGRPTPRNTTAATGELVVGRAGTTEYVPSDADPSVLVPYVNPGAEAVGETGIAISVAPDAVPDGTVLRVRKLGPDADPPAAVGDLWWCGMIEISDVPAGAEVWVYQTARRPLPPNMPLAVFEQRDGRWERSAAMGFTDFSGQTLIFPSRGGLLAVGAPSGVRPLNVGTSATGGTGATGQATATPTRTTSVAVRATIVPPTVGPVATATPVGTVRSLQRDLPASTFGNTSDASIPGDSEPALIRASRKARLLSCASSGSPANSFCTNAGGGWTSCEGYCHGFVRQGGFFRRDGVNSCVVNVDGQGQVTEVMSCNFQPD